MSSITPLYPRIESLSVQNYRVLQNITLERLAPLSILIGPNGSGKSTVLDVLSFLHECFTGSLKEAWDKRNGLRGIRSHDNDGPIRIEIIFRLEQNHAALAYRLEIDEDNKHPVIRSEFLSNVEQGWEALAFFDGMGSITDGDRNTHHELSSPDLLAVNVFGQLASTPFAPELRKFVLSWTFANIRTDANHVATSDIPERRLNRDGTNLANVISYWQEQYPAKWREVVARLRTLVPKLRQVSTRHQGTSLNLYLRDKPFKQSITAKFASEGTLKLLAYLLLLYDPEPPTLLAWEEPENQLNPALLYHLAEDFRVASAQSQLFITTHAPHLVDGFRPEEIWAFTRGTSGFTQVKRTEDMQGIPQFYNTGGLMGDLWMEGQFEFLNPPLNEDISTRRPR
jgi:predicted ATPase